jgi:hypothetical protein
VWMSLASKFTGNPKKPDFRSAGMTFESTSSELEFEVQQLRRELQEQKAIIAGLDQLRSEWKDFEKT